MKSKSLLRAISVLALLVAFLPFNDAVAKAFLGPAPDDMFQLPWELGQAWMAIDGIDNGSRRPLSSSHNYSLGGAIDFAPRSRMFTGENTSNFWVTAAASGTVTQTSSCFVTITHSNGWTTQYMFLGNIQVQLGEVIARNERLGIIADGVRYKYCPGFQEINVPHLHFILRPSLSAVKFAGWEVGYSPFFNRTTFTKGLISVGLFKPLLNVMDPVVTATPTMSLTSTSTAPPSTTPTLSAAYVSTTLNLSSINVGATAVATVSLNNVPTAGYSSAEFTCTYNPALLEVSNIVMAGLFGTDPVSVINDPQDGSFIVAIAGSNGQKATASGPVFNFDLEALQAGQAVVECRARVSAGDNVLTAIEYIPASLTITDDTVTATPTTVPGESPTPVESPTPSGSPVPSESPVPTVSHTPTPPPVDPPPVTSSPTPTPIPPDDWLTFINLYYGFQFRYPPESELVAGNTDTHARINLPFTQGTNLVDKYLEVTVREDLTTCRSPLASSSIVETSESLFINGIIFLKETGGDAGAGNLYQWVAYSTTRDNDCVSLDFVLHSLNPGNYATPPPVFDFAAESAVFGQIAGTYTWFPPGQSATPTSSTPVFSTPTSSTPAASPTPDGSATTTPTQIPTSSPTLVSTQPADEALNGQVLASKPVTITVLDAGNVVVGTETVSGDGTFSLDVPAGTYTVVASASGFLRAQASVTITDGTTTTLPDITLLAGDIDGNDVIDQFDAMTIGMSYNTTTPAAADLNNDGTINVLDLELLAQNYRETGPTAWE
jgi:murein DD-endopeptidase MepM/ murein hydrolase activator NlpD